MRLPPPRPTLHPALGTRRSILPWPMMAMEAALVYPLVAHWLTGPDGRAPLGPLAALVMLPLGYLATRHSPIRGVPVARADVGIGLAFTLRLLTAPPSPAAIQEGPLLGPLEWLLSAVLPALVGFGLWWRGGALADAELTADGVRDEFLIVGAALLGVLVLFRDAAGIDALTSAAAVIAYLGAGLVAVGLARQEQAGLAPTAASTGVVAATTLALLVASVGLVALLSPELAGIILGLLGQAVGALFWLVTLPLAWLLSRLNLRLPLATDLPTMRPVQPPPELAERPLPPEWLLQLIGVLVSVLAVLGILVVAAALIWLLLALLQRVEFRPGVRGPVAMEADGTPWQDARDAIGGVRSWLLRLAGGARAATRRSDSQVRDARAAYRVLLRWASARGVARAPAETPAELQRRLVAYEPAAAAHYAVLTAAYERARYGGTATSAAELARLRASLQALDALPPSRRPDPRERGEQP
ncbi:MAG TPA: DUF4129 domain-containing protein [Chloroflexota bacterium]|nr:DUF4129 domain-containing protein [Chloroflexota bacterium]